MDLEWEGLQLLFFLFWNSHILPRYVIPLSGLFDLFSLWGPRHIGKSPVVQLKTGQRDGNLSEEELNLILGLVLRYPQVHLIGVRTCSTCPKITLIARAFSLFPLGLMASVVAPGIAMHWKLWQEKRWVIDWDGPRWTYALLLARYLWMYRTTKSNLWLDEKQMRKEWYGPVSGPISYTFPGIVKEPKSFSPSKISSLVNCGDMCYKRKVTK